MTSVFNGMASVLNTVFGTPVTHVARNAGGTRQITSVLRRDPVEVDGPDGRPVLVIAPTWRVTADQAADINRFDEVAHEGRSYRVMNRIESANPAPDRFVLFELEEIE